MPLAEVAGILAAEDPDARAALIAGHLRRLEAELERTITCAVGICWLM